ncbi:hypothetical protein ACJJTC_016327 [Scirpophaga incertulas]
MVMIKLCEPQRHGVSNFRLSGPNSAQLDCVEGVQLKLLSVVVPGGCSPLGARKLENFWSDIIKQIPTYCIVFVARRKFQRGLGDLAFLTMAQTCDHLQNAIHKNGCGPYRCLVWRPRAFPAPFRTDAVLALDYCDDAILHLFAPFSRK